MAMAEFVARVPSPVLREMLLLMRVDRPIGTWLLLWPALWSLFAASGGRPDMTLVVIMGVGAFVMRSAGCVANDMADYKIDAQVARTRERPLAAGRISMNAARMLLFTLLCLALLLVFQLNRFTLWLAGGGAFLAVTYPLTKRFLPIPQLYMGLAFAWGGVMAWAAASGTLTGTTWLLFFAVVAWAAGYDTLYAMMDREDDVHVGIHSSALFFGQRDIPAVAALYAVALLLLFAAGLSLALPPFYYLALMIAQGHMAWQLWYVRGHERGAGYDKGRLLTAFLSNKWTGFIILVGFAWGPGLV